MAVKQKIVTAFFILFSFASLAQPVSYNFRHFTTSDGLGDGIIRCIAQDKYGFMWFGSVNGLTIYNGYSSKVIDANAHDPYALKDIAITSLCKDKNGTMWLAQASGLYQYEYSTGHFIFQQGTSDFSITKLYSGGTGLLYLATKKGLKVFNITTKKIQPESTDAASILLLNNSVIDMASINTKTIYLATDTGVVVYNAMQKTTSLLLIQLQLKKEISQLAIDKKERLWCSDGATIFRVDKNKTLTTYPHLNGVKGLSPENRVNSLFVDNSGQLWIATNRAGLCLYNETENKFTAFRNDPLQEKSISSDLITALFQGTDGTIWIGTEGYGLDYFNPDRSFFHSLLPSFHQSPTLPDNWCRASSEDKNGQWWLATATGVAVYNLNTDEYKIFQNKEGGKKELYSNSVRSVLCASDGTVWIGTANGLNRYHPQTGVMDFIGEKESMPQSFFWNMVEDKQHKIWFACRDGIYIYDPVTKRFDDNGANKSLSPYCRFRIRTIFIDSHYRMWFGLDGKGLLLYDPVTGVTKQWMKKEGDSTSLTNDFITSIAEDKKGIIWVSTFSGLNALNQNTGCFQQYYKNAGLPSNKISGLVVDDANRVWMGTSKGLCMLDAGRKYFKSFGIEDGLVSIEFSDQSAYRLMNEVILYPTLKGFLYFNPAAYKLQSASLPTYLTSFKVYNEVFPLATNSEEIKTIDLSWNKNFFSFTIASPDYVQAEQTTYAYWLEPFDKNWVYTKERTRNYTNVPGGIYTLHIKASNNLQNWNVPETKIRVSVGTVFYKTWWFIAIVVILFLWSFYAVYRYRLRQHQRVMDLQAKATALEKEKTLALYESLKQQLNPHFLFNSLSSLSGLIQKDQGAAKTFLDQLSKIYRYILKSGQTETVRVSEDLKLAQTYVQLQQTRFGSGLQLKIDLDEEDLNRKIAPVTIQNLIENAIKHNIIDAETPLIISISSADDFLVVQNNLQRKNFVEGSNRQGLQNMKTLYRYLSGRSIIIDETQQNFIIKIPFV